MKSTMASAVVSIAALSSCTLGSVVMKIAKSTDANLPIKRRYLGGLEERATITENLINNFTGGQYVAQVSVGTPPQKLNLALDTGSSDVWVMSSTADLCTSAELQSQSGRGGCQTPFTSSKSSTFKIVDQGAFNISYVDGTGSTGDYVTDTFSIGGATIKALEMGYATQATLPIGLIGIGYSVNEASDSGNAADPFIYPNIIDTMLAQGLINTKAYSLYLDDYQASTGSIIFGGLDSDKFSGSLLALPVIQQQYSNGSIVYATLAVELNSITATGLDGTTTSFTTSSFSVPVVLDSGTTLTYLPTSPAKNIYNALGAVDDTQNTGQVYVDCTLKSKEGVTFNYGFGGANGITISVPITEIILDYGPIPQEELPPTITFTDVCILGIQSSGDEGPWLLGDTFLRSAYVVYDLQNNQIAIGQTNFNSTETNLVEFTATQTAIPDVSGVASAATLTESATGIPGKGGVTSSVTGTGTGGPATVTKTLTPSASKGAAGTVPAFDSRGLIILGISGAMAVLGGGWFLS